LRNDPQSIGRLSEVIIEEASRKDGGILILFTSRDIMKRTWDVTASALRVLGHITMMQGEHIQNRTMLEIMRESDNAVIFGLDSFWEGVDIRGDALKCLIITKLPFEVPTEPITLARTEDIEQRGGNSFYEYSLPRAVIKFRQGFGRLIRSKTDTGRIIICDDRIETKRYGKKFLQSIYG
jgi:ATP-dependent DNA helicase DinG